MAKFPKSEAEVVALIQEMISGITNNNAIYPAPPVSIPMLTGVLSAYQGAKNAATEAQAQAEQAIVYKNDALQNMIDDMKQDLRYAENTVNYDDAKLKLIGWGGKAAATALQPPGQARSLEAPREGEGWLYLDWKQPVDGGTVASYKVERRLRPDGPWATTALAMESEITLTDQERGKEWEYRVKAVNKAGEGEPSNTIMAVL